MAKNGKLYGLVDNRGPFCKRVYALTKREFILVMDLMDYMHEDWELHQSEDAFFERYHIVLNRKERK